MSTKQKNRRNPTPIRFGDLYDEIEELAITNQRTFSDQCRYLVRVGIQSEKPAEVKNEPREAGAYADF
jgi:hypothetical protein